MEEPIPKVTVTFWVAGPSSTPDPDKPTAVRIVADADCGWDLVNLAAKTMINKPGIQRVLMDTYDRQQHTYTVTAHCAEDSVPFFTELLCYGVLAIWDAEHP